MIPDDAVEAAARVMADRINAAGYIEAEDLSNVSIDIQDFDMRGALLAALDEAARVRDEANPFKEPGEHSVVKNEDGTYEHTFKPFGQEA